MENITANALKELNQLNEEVFSFDTKGLEDLKVFLDGDLHTEAETIIDPEASSEEELKDSYEGKVVLCCDVCQSLIYKDEDAIEIDEETGEANEGEECPFCQSMDGFKIVGVIAPYEDGDSDENLNQKSVDDVDTKEDIHVEAKVEESYKENKKKLHKKQLIQEAEKIANKRLSLKRRKFNEDFHNITVENTDSITTTTIDESGKVTVTTDKKDVGEFTDKEETIVPVTPEVKANIEREKELPDNLEDNVVDIDIDEIDEEGFDQLGESYLKRVYENVKSYKTVAGHLNGNKLMLEGVLTFKSGKSAKTNFIFESKYKTPKGKLKFLGENVQLSNCKKAYTLTGGVEGKKLVLESLTYNYNAKDATTGKSQRFCGTVKNRRLK